MKNEKTQPNQYPASQYHPTSKKKSWKRTGCNAMPRGSKQMKWNEKEWEVENEKWKVKKELVRNRLFPQHAQFLQFRPSMIHIRSFFEHRP